MRQAKTPRIPPALLHKPAVALKIQSETQKTAF